MSCDSVSKIVQGRKAFKFGSGDTMKTEQGQSKGRGAKSQPRAKLSERKAIARGVAAGTRKGKPNLSALEAFSSAWTSKPVPYIGVYKK